MNWELEVLYLEKEIKEIEEQMVKNPDDAWRMRTNLSQFKGLLNYAKSQLK